MERGEGENSSYQKLSRTSYALGYIKAHIISLTVPHEFPIVCRESMYLCMGRGGILYLHVLLTIRLLCLDSITQKEMLPSHWILWGQ